MTMVIRVVFWVSLDVKEIKLAFFLTGLIIEARPGKMGWAFSC